MFSGDRDCPSNTLKIRPRARIFVNGRWGYQTVKTALIRNLDPHVGEAGGFTKGARSSSDCDGRVYISPLFPC
jgi:hypothetical protein